MKSLMIPLLSLTLAAVADAQCGAYDSRATPELGKAVQLFDGKTLDGWHVKSGTATYRVEDGAIVGRTTPGSPNTFLCTEREYGDFELTFEVLLHDKPLNSGVQVRSKLKGDQYGGRVGGPQIEIEASPGQAGYIYGEALGTGWLSPEPRAKDKSARQHSHFQNQQWNHYRVLAVGDRIQTWINGRKITDVTLPPKIAEAHAKGLIGLQVHGVGKKAGPFQVRWRNIQLREVKPTSR